jgi:hypothetical protein
MPGDYGVDEAENNIRYGKIPQRVPRRFKTIKKVECVLFTFVPRRAMSTSF